MYVANHSMVVLNTISLFLLQGGEPEAGSSPPEQLVAQDFEVTSPTTAPCYGVLGCFPITAPWSTESRPFPFYPERPEKVNPLFCLRTRHNRDKCQYLRAGDEHSVYRSHFRAGSPVFLIVHGYLESQRRAWMQKATAELLIYKPDANVILVDWNGGSSPPYAQAVANIRVVGAVTAHLLKTLITTLGVDPRSIHIIGHSLGAHAAAYVGSNLQTFGYKIGRITGLDAAEPRFTGTDALVRLDPTDAEFVDAIHTDAAPFMAGGLGIREPVGHVDFYPNGGRDQPGCAEGMSNFISEKGSVLRGTECGIANQPPSAHNNRVLGVHDTGYVKYPWFALLHRIGTTSNFDCGGSLITPRHVLTAAHIFPTDSYEPLVALFEVTLGLHDRCDNRSSEAKTFTTIKVDVHEKFINPLYGYDIALVTLNEEADFMPVCLPIIGSPIVHQYDVTIAGFGKLRFLYGNGPCEMKEATVEIFTPEKCMELDGTEPLIGRNVVNLLGTEYAFCAGVLEGAVDIWDFDSGTPIILKQDNRYVQQGIASFSLRVNKNLSPQLNLPAMYTHVSTYVDWINERTAAPVDNIDSAKDDWQFFLSRLRLIFNTLLKYL